MYVVCYAICCNCHLLISFRLRFVYLFVSLGVMVDFNPFQF